MPALPHWHHIIHWNPDPAIDIATLNADRSIIPDSGGFYAFTADPGPLKVGKVLYVGETVNLRNRLPNYLHRDPRQTRNRHKGALFIMDYRVRISDDKKTFVRWSLFEGDYTLQRDLEAALMQFYQTRFNHRDRDHMLD